MTVAHVYTVAFQGIEAREVDVQVHIGEGAGGVFNIVGLGRQGGRRKQGARARGAVRHRACAPLQAAHGQSRAGRSAERGKPLRSSHCARASGRDGRAAGKRDGELCRDGRAVARCADHRRCGRSACRHRGVGAAARSHLSGRLRTGSGVGRRPRDHRRAVADRARQSHEGRAGAESAGRETGRGSCAALPI